MNISVGDMMRYATIKGSPISGLAITCLMNGWNERTIVMTDENKDDELYQDIKIEKYKWRHNRNK